MLSLRGRTLANRAPTLAQKLFWLSTVLQRAHSPKPQTHNSKLNHGRPTFEFRPRPVRDVGLQRGVMRRRPKKTDTKHQPQRLKDSTPPQNQPSDLLGRAGSRQRT